MQKIIKLKKNPTLKDLLATSYQVYGIPNDRDFSMWEIFSNQEKYLMRALKGVRKGDIKKVEENLIIATSWFCSIINRMHIDLEKAIWERFPYTCSYCAQTPCACGTLKPRKRPLKITPKGKRPTLIRSYQEMFAKIYPVGKKTLTEASIHLAEEHGELSEAIQVYYGSHKEKAFQYIADEAADYFSCICGVCNRADINLEKELQNFFFHNCHACGRAPCVCGFDKVSSYQS